MAHNYVPSRGFILFAITIGMLNLVTLWSKSCMIYKKQKKNKKKEQHWKSITFNFAPLTAPFICLAQVSCLHAISTCNEEINSNCGIIIFRWSPPWLVMQFIKAQLYHQLIIIGHYIHSHAAHVNQQTAKCINIA